jgi:bifunctional non-homologous end joining protein LigD
MNPNLIKPMLLMPVTEARIPADDAHILEPKLDGWRAIVYKQGNEVKIISRELNDMTGYFPQVVSESVICFRGLNLVLDGELVTFDEPDSARPDILPRQNRNLLRRKNQQVYFYPFDVLRIGDTSAIGSSLDSRRQLLTGIMQLPIDEPRDLLHIQQVEAFDATKKEKVLRVAKRDRWEGVVAKRRSSTYQPNYRGRDWLKHRFKEPRK